MEDDGYHRIYDRDGENYFEIPHISILDAGEYSCIATNMMGAIYSTFNICVEGSSSPFVEGLTEERIVALSLSRSPVAMTEPESTGSEMEERSANVSDADANAVSCF